jgi:hypothetical protein
MSIYATLWSLKFPIDGDVTHDCQWIEVIAQGVPPHIGTPIKDHGYEDSDPYSAFLPPSISVDSEGDAPFLRAVVFVTEFTRKATERSPQEYESPLFVLTGEEYSRITFEELHSRICDSLRGSRAPVVAEIFLGDGGHKIIRKRQ